MILIIAYGNSLRRDDGAGLLAAVELEAILCDRDREVERIAVHQLAPELSETIARPEIEAVVFVDARAAANGEGAVEPPGLEILPLSPEDFSPSMGHHLDPAVLLTLAGRLFGRTPPAWLLTVPGVDFGHGESLSPVAQRALSDLRALIAGLPPDWP